MEVKRVVSVIIVNFNGGELLVNCVHSVLASTFPVTVYLVDNASVDGSFVELQRVIGSDKRVHFLKNAHNLGFASATNLVLPYITSDYLLFLNPDCLVYPDTLAKFVKIMDEYSKAGMAGALVRNPDGSEQVGCRRNVPTPWRTVVRVFHLNKLFPNSELFRSFVLSEQPLPTFPIEIEGISGACMFVRRSALLVVGPMDENYFLHCEDLDWFMRFRALHFKILFVPTIEVVHVKGVCSRSQPFRILWYKHRGMVRFYRKFFRHKYPFLLWWGVKLAVWVRFAVLVMITLVVPSRFL